MLKVAWSDRYPHPLPEGHRFPMEKYSLILDQLLYQGIVKPENIFTPAPALSEDIFLAHDAHYWQKLQNHTLTAKEIRKIGFPFSAELVNREREIVQGTIDCARFALQEGVALNIAGGTHHAYSDSGEGFCILNDIAVAAHYLLKNKMAHRILIIDLDVHQGNGTAKIFENIGNVFTFSMHGEANYPLFKEKSDCDIALKTGTGDQVFLATLQDVLPQIWENFRPDFVFYLSGVDILHTDKLGKLACTLSGCRKRDEWVLSWCKQHSVPVAIAMGGGYSPKIQDIVDAHCQTFHLAQMLWG